MRKVCIISSSRADYGIFSRLIKKLQNDKKIKSYFIITGSHLLKKFGETQSEIIKDKVLINKKILLKNLNDNKLSITKSISNLTYEYGKYFLKIRPQLLLILGDRFEIHTAAIVASIFNIPIAHFHGGEITEGAIDEGFRHSISKLSHIHFVTHNQYKKNLIQLGESKQNIFNIGSMSLDNISNTKLLTRKQAEKFLNFKFKNKNILVTYHPVTLEPEKTEINFNKILKCLKKVKEVGIIFTYPNFDYGNSPITKLIDKFVKYNQNRSVVFKSLGYNNYISILKHVDIVMGNSSSAIIEAPFLKTYTLNIGNRQKGRLTSKNVISCNDTEKSIFISLKKILKLSNNRPLSDKMFYKKNSVKKAIKIIKEIKLNNILIKKFNKINN